MRLTYGTYIIQMDISETSTICTLQQQMPILQEWALELVKKGLKAELQNLLAALPMLPIIQDLDANGIRLKDLSETQLKDLKSIAWANDDHVIAIKQQQLLTKFKDNQNELIETFQASQRMVDDFNEKEQMKYLAGKLRNYVRDSGTNFEEYLEFTKATKAQKYAFKYYYDLQELALMRYFRFQKLAFANLGMTFELNENGFVRSENGSKSSSLNKKGQTGQAGQKGGKGWKGGKRGKDKMLRTESVRLKTEPKKSEKSLVMRTERSSLKPEKNQSKTKPKKM